MNNITELLANWNVTKGKLKKKFSTLTDNDVLLVQGKHEEVIGRLQVKLSKTEDEILKLIAEL